MSATDDPMPTLSLVEVAAALELHYMTVYRYVRTGRLPATLVGHEWRVRREDLDALRTPSRPPARPRADAAARRLEERLVAGDESGAWRIVDDALAAGHSPTDVHLDILVPALRHIGEGWREGRVSIADEHRASATARRVIARLGPRFARPGRRRGTVVIGAVSGEWHDIPAALVADQLRGAGYAVVELGSNTPAESFLEAVGHGGIVAVVVSVTTPGLEAVVRETTARVRAAGVPVVVGGSAVPSPEVALSLGSDEWSGRDARDVVALVDQIRERRVADRRRRR